MVLAAFVFSGVCVIAHLIIISSILAADKEERPAIETGRETYWNEIYL